MIDDVRALRIALLLALVSVGCTNNEGPECCVLRNLCQSGCGEACDERGLTDIYLLQDEAMCRSAGGWIAGCGMGDDGGFTYTREEAEAICIPTE